MPENQVALPVCEPVRGNGVDGIGAGPDVVPEVGVGVIPGVAVIPGVGVAVVDPLHAFPFTVKFVGTGLLVDHEPLKPGVTDPLTATLPFQLSLTTVTFWPDCVNVPFQPCVTV